MAGAPRSVPLYPVAKVRKRSKGEAYRVAKNSKARRASGVALCTTAEGKPKRPVRRVFGFAGCAAAQSERHSIARSACAMTASISCTDTFFKGDDMHSPLVLGMNQFAEIYNRPAFTPTAARIYKKATGIEDERQFFLKLLELTKTLRTFPLPADFTQPPTEVTKKPD